MKIKTNIYSIPVSEGKQGQDEIELISNCESLQETGKELNTKILWKDEVIFDSEEEAKIFILASKRTQENTGCTQLAVQYKKDNELMWYVNTEYDA